MPIKNLDDFVGSIREGVADTGGKVQDVVQDVAEKIEEALHDVKVEGQDVRKKVQAELVKRWEKADKLGRENAFVMALGALGVGILIGFLLARDRD
jgi:ElaB/YqjD/DUF883 family membrane-anchored ribosome-binding protein